jgi:hypothetical protein
MAGGKLISTGVEFPDATTQTTSGLPLTGGTMTGALTTTGFTSTGIDDNATSTKLTVANTGIDVTGSVTCDELNVSTVGTNRVDISNTSLTDTGEMVSLQWDTNADFTIQGRDSAAGFKANWYRIEASASDGLADSHIWYTGASAEAMRINSSGLLKIGTSSTVAPYALSKFAIDTGTYTYMDLLSTASSGINFGDAGGAQRGTIEYDHGSDYLRFGAAGSERMRIDSDGNVTVKTGNLVIGTSGKGIDFSATSDGSGTMTSEVLDDYEEGTWTCVLNGVTGGNTTGYYTKVGNLVTIAFYSSSMTATAVSAGFSGLPFTISPTYPVFSTTHNSWTPNATTGYFNTGTTSGYIVANGSITTETATGGTKYIMISGTYIAA